MRVPVPGGDHWVELRDVTKLTGGDEEAWGAELAEAQDQRALDDFNSADDAPKAPLRIAPGWQTRRQDALLASLVTDWSYDKPGADPQVSLPYSADARRQLPREANHALAGALVAYAKALEETPGPKEPEPPTSTTDGSGSGSD